MSTISRALEKHQLEDDGSDPDSILARNAIYREAMRRPRRDSSNNRVAFIMATVCLATVLVVLLIVLPGVTSRPRTEVADTPGITIQPTVPAPEPTATPIPSQPTPAPTPLPFPTPLPLQEVQLRIGQFNPHPVTYDPEVLPPLLMEPLPVYVPEQTPVMAEVPPPPVSSRAEPRARSAEPAPPKPTLSENPTEFLNLSGILMDPKKPSALINDEIVYVGDTVTVSAGDTVRQVKVLSIDNSSTIQVEYKGKKHTLTIN